MEELLKLSLLKFTYDGVDLISNYTGKYVGTVRSNGYRQVHILFGGKKCHISNHQVIHYMETGKVSKYFIDHIDRDKLNNRIDNLRELTNRQNQFNIEVKPMTNIKHNKFGGYEVAFGRKHYVYLGTFKTLEEAQIARDTYRNSVIEGDNNGKP
ncbi:MAG: HNH endonuclease signature motif containing protein [Shewanella oncorhynchi]